MINIYEKSNGQNKGINPIRDYILTENAENLSKVQHLSSPKSTPGKDISIQIIGRKQKDTQKKGIGRIIILYTNIQTRILHSLAIMEG